MTKTMSLARAAVSALGLWALLGSLLIALPASPAEGLGISVRVKPEAGSEVENNNYLWLSADTSGTAERTIEISSNSQIPQRIYFELYDEIDVDGQLAIDPAGSTEAVRWLSFSPAEAILQPGETIQVKANFDPQGQDLSYFGFVRILAESAQEQTVEADEGTGYRAFIAGKAAIQIPVWFGAGVGGATTTDFEITGLRGVIDDEGQKKIQLTIRNLGDTPITPAGTVSFADPAFSSLTAGPFEFRSGTIRPGRTLGVLIDIDESLTEQPWRALAEARQGPIVRTKSFDLQLTFVELGSVNLLALLIQIGLLLVGLALAFVGLRLFRGKGKQPPREPRTIKGRAPKPDPTPNQAATPSVEELMAQLGSSNAQNFEQRDRPNTFSNKGKSPKQTPQAPATSAPPAIEDPWEFLLAARNSRWSDANTTTKEATKPGKTRATVGGAKATTGGGKKTPAGSKKS